MRLGIAQIDTVPGAFDETVERMVAQSRRAAEQGVELLAFPLAALAGVDVVPFSDRISYMRDVADAVASLSEHLACPAIVAVPMDLGDAEGFYEVLLVEHGEVRPLRMMSHLHGQASPGGSRDSDVPEFDYGGLHFALALSHADLDDLDDYDYDIDAVLFLSGYPFAMDDPSSAMGADLEGARFVDDARTMQAWLAGVAPVGGYGDEVFSGSSFVLAPSGDLVASAPAFEEALICADLEAVAPELPVPPLAPEVFDAPFHLWQAVSLGIHDFVTKQGRSDVALCLDGTLAAFVLAALASDALGPLHVHVLVGASAGRRAPSCRELVARLRVDHVDAVGRLGDFDPRDLDARMSALEETLLGTAPARPDGRALPASPDGRALPRPIPIAIGEIGLDYSRGQDAAARARQRALFAAQLRLAARLGLPCSIHSREAEADTVAVLRENLSPDLAAAGRAGALHCFVGPTPFAAALAPLGLSFGLSGIVTFRNADALRAVVPTLPRDRILVETDAPYLAPVPVRGRRCEPAFAAHTARFLAGLLGLPEPDAFALFGANARRLYAP